MKRLFQAAVFGGFLALGIVTVVPPTSVSAASCKGTAVECAKQGVGESGGRGQGTVDTRVKDIVNLLIYVVGIIAVIMIVVGGLRYVLSGGDSSNVSGAKNTILYAVIGLVVAILAYAIVNFVINSVSAAPARDDQKSGNSINGE